MLIVSALTEELNAVKEKLETVSSNFDQLDISFLKTNPGIHAARNILDSHLLANSYDIVVNIGTAGSLNSCLQLKDIFFATSFSTGSRQSSKNSAVNSSIQNIIPKLPENWKLGALYTSAIPVTSQAKKQEIFNIFNATAVDMEAFPLAKICLKNSIPFISVKVITDYADSLTDTTFQAQLPDALPLLGNSAVQLLNIISKNLPESSSNG